MNLGLATVQPADVRVHDTGHERDRRPLHDEMLRSYLRLHDRECLRQRVARARGRHVGPQEIHQVVTRKLAPAFHRQADQQGEVLARAKADLLTGFGKQERCA